jgi:hypothetical protein
MFRRLNFDPSTCKKRTQLDTIDRASPYLRPMMLKGLEILNISICRPILCVWVNRDSSVGIANSYGLYNRGFGVRVPVGSRTFSMSFRLGLGPTQPPIQWVPGTLFLGVKRPGHEADHSPPTTAEVKKIRIYTSTPPYAFMA